MEADAETLFDYLGKRYEDAFADNPNLRKFVTTAATKLPEKSKVLDVGCGTGKPVANILASMGHDVYGIDISQEMVNVASSQIKESFQKADMMNMSHLGLMYLVYKWAEWLKPGGLLVIGVTPSTSLPENQCTYDTA